MIVVSNGMLVFFGRPEKIKNQVCEIKYFNERTAGWPESMEDIVQFAVDSNGDIANDEKVIYWDEHRVWHGIDVKNNQFRGVYSLRVDELKELKIDPAKNAEAMINYHQDNMSR